MNHPYDFTPGSSPLLISIPHTGTRIPEHLLASMRPVAKEVSDTDWHLHLLYNMAEKLGASLLTAEYSRYVIDLNRSPDDSNLYPGQDTTGLCPVNTFDWQDLYPAGAQPNLAEIESRKQQYWQPYHQKLREELQRLRAEHGVAVLWDAHSIASRVPRFFQGKLTDLNFGTAGGTSCDPSLQQALRKVVEKQGGNYSHVFDGRFKGGYITRHYGQPEQNIHTVQLEMTRTCYMDDDAPYGYREDLARQIQPLLTSLLMACQVWALGNRK